ncbi:MAG: dihydroorotate dehydrogenase catalytic subunit, partial [Chloroflexota bacterium]|nr:dihydroorotate dehydrogenase catalytic subunit [Chloroflexota bacterium]
RLHAQGIPLIASIFAPTVEEFGRMAAGVSAAEPDLIEVNISCPNVGDEFGTPFSGSVESASAVTRVVKANTDIPVAIKLSPNVPNIARIALAAQEAGADVLTAINTVPGMLIDPYAGRPVLANKVGGVSGWSIKPIALRCVAEICKAVSVPVIGLGGVSSGLDAAEMIMAGATAVGVGSAVWQRGVEVFNTIADELQAFMAAEGYADLESMRGIAIR